MKTPEEIKKGLELCGDEKCNCHYCIGCPYDGTTCDIELNNDALAYIQQLEQRLVEVNKTSPRWISVNERLPEQDQDVLLIAHGWSHRTIYIGRLHHMEATTSWLTGITSKDSEWSISGWSYLRTPEVTHWMEMPEPPKEENENVT